MIRAASWDTSSQSKGFLFYHKVMHVTVPGSALSSESLEPSQDYTRSHARSTSPPDENAPRLTGRRQKHCYKNKTWERVNFLPCAQLISCSAPRIIRTLRRQRLLCLYLMSKREWMLSETVFTHGHEGRRPCSIERRRASQRSLNGCSVWFKPPEAARTLMHSTKLAEWLLLKTSRVSCRPSSHVGLRVTRREGEGGGGLWVG